MSESVDEKNQRAAAADRLSQRATLARRAGQSRKAAELLEAAMVLDPSSERIRAWALGTASFGTAAQRSAMQEVASWF